MSDADGNGPPALSSYNSLKALDVPRQISASEAQRRGVKPPSKPDSASASVKIPSDVRVRPAKLES